MWELGENSDILNLHSGPGNKMILLCCQSREAMRGIPAFQFNTLPPTTQYLSRKQDRQFLMESGDQDMDFTLQSSKEDSISPLWVPAKP